MLARKINETIPRSIRRLRSLAITLLDPGITFHQTRVLYLIKEGLGQSEIAESMQVSAAAVCKLMRELSEKGLIVMNPGEDRRSRKIRLTPEGKKRFSAISRQIERKLNKLTDGLTPGEKDDLMKGLIVLDKLFGQIKEG